MPFELDDETLTGRMLISTPCHTWPFPLLMHAIPGVPTYNPYMWHYTHHAFTVHQLPALSDNYIYLIEMPEALAVVDPADAVPVIQACETLGRGLTHILNTHHHWDHTDGNLALKLRYGCCVVGARTDETRIPGMDVRVSEAGNIRLGTRVMRVLEVPGHTRGHIAFILDDALFCGDTLFGAGCGRLFEGTAAQMWHSLGKLARLPGETRFYCAHEYTLNNLKFALGIDPNNAALTERKQRVEAKRAAGAPTIPGTIGEERATNPFLRPLDADFCRWYARTHGIEDDAVCVFAHIREARNHW